MYGLLDTPYDHDNDLNKDPVLAVGPDARYPRTIDSKSIISTCNAPLIFNPDPLFIISNLIINEKRVFRATRHIRLNLRH